MSRVPTMRWLKWYAIDWINSTARDELTPAERSTWVDFVCLARFPGSPPGTFKFASYEALARKLNTPLEVILSTCDKCLKNRITVDITSEGLLINILNWDRYQSGQGDNKKAHYSPKTDNKRGPQRREEKSRVLLSKDNNKGSAPMVFGEAKNVGLTQEELEKLRERFSNIDERIEALSVYKASTGKRYKSDYYTILNWERMPKKGAHGEARGFAQKRGSQQYTEPLGP